MNKIVYKFLKTLYIIFQKKELLMSLNINYYESKGVKIGQNMRAFSPLISAEPYLLSFGDNVTISTNVTFLTHDNSVIKLFNNATDTFGEIIIGDNCFVGSGVIIMPGVEIGDNIIVGAGSVVTKSFTDGNVVIAGNPAKVVSTTKDYAQKVEPYALNVKGMSFNQKKIYLIERKEYFLKK